MIPTISRLSPDQTKEIELIKDFRSRAAALRNAASRGTYDDAHIRQFWQLCESAGLILYASNSELAQRAGLGDGYFSSIPREQRRPKLTNLMKALSVFIEVADERLFEVERSEPATSKSAARRSGVVGRLQEHHTELASLAFSLSKLAEAKIDELDHELPNDPEAVARNKTQRELLTILADGFKKIADALQDIVDNTPEPILLGKAADIVNSVGAAVNDWWARSKNDAIDMSVKIPVFTAGVAALGWAGANMTVATSAIAAIVGGPKLIASITKKKPRSED